MPRWLQWLERILLSADDREFLGGDLAEDFRRTARERGVALAASRHVAELFRVAPRRPAALARRLAQDVRFAFRALRGRPVYAAAGTLTLAVAIGATTAMYSVADAVLLSPLPYRTPDRLLFVSSSFPGATGGGDQLSFLEIRDIAERAKTLEAIASYHTGRALQLRGSGEPERVRANVVDPHYLEILGARAVLGRLFAADAPPDEQAVAVLSHRFWTNRLGADPGIIGRTIVLSDVALTVRGVLGPEFRDISAEEGFSFDSDVFVPAPVVRALGSPALLTTRTARNYWALARVREGYTVQQARAEIAAIGEQLQRELPESNRGFTFWGERLDTRLARDIRGPILLLLGGSALVLLIACANVANLVLARASSRARELDVRRALGASRAQILVLVFAESAAITVTGGVLGFLASLAGDDLFIRLVPGELTPRLAGVGLNGRVLACAGGLTALVTLVLGTLTAARRTVLAGAPRDRGTAGVPGGRVRRTLLIAEVATAVALVAGAYLMLGSLVQLRRSDPGFRAERLLTAEIDLQAARYREAPAVHRFGRELHGALEGIPGVEDVALWGPGRPGRNTWVTFPGREDAPVSTERLMTWRHTVTPGALRAVGIPLHAGREFTDSDVAGTTPVVIVSQTLARTLWPGEDAVGKRLRWRSDVPDAPLLTVVGVAGDAKHRGRINDLLYPARDLYVPHAQRGDRTVVAVVRAAAGPESIAAAIRAAVRSVDADLPVFNLTTMAAHMATEEAETRFAAVLMTTYALVALVLAAIGIYGVLSYHVALRAREMAVRIALGASRSAVVRLVVEDGLRPAVVGIGIGLLGAWILGRSMTSMLFGVEPANPLAMAGVAGTLLVVVMLAAWLPARAATRVDPMRVLASD